MHKTLSLFQIFMKHIWTCVFFFFMRLFYFWTFMHFYIRIDCFVSYLFSSVMIISLILKMISTRSPATVVPLTAGNGWTESIPCYSMVLLVPEMWLNMLAKWYICVFKTCLASETRCCLRRRPLSRLSGVLTRQLVSERVQCFCFVFTEENVVLGQETRQQAGKYLNVRLRSPAKEDAQRAGHSLIWKRGRPSNKEN